MKIITYTSPTCSYCRMLKEFLAERGIVYEDHDVTTDAAAAQEAARIAGQNAVPVIVVDGQVMVGFERTRLEQLLSQAQAKKGPSFGAVVGDSRKMVKEDTPVIGAFVLRTRQGSAAEKIGLLPGDIIIQVNQERIASARDLETALSTPKEKARFTIVFSRGNVLLRAEAALSE